MREGDQGGVTSDPEEIVLMQVFDESNPLFKVIIQFFYIDWESTECVD